MEKNRTPIFGILALAQMWVGIHLGLGVVSGAQISQFWVSQGIWGIAASVVAMCLLGRCLYCAMEFARIYKTYNYGNWIRGVCGKPWVSLLFDFSFIITVLAVLGNSLNLASTLLCREFFQSEAVSGNVTGTVPYWIGIIAIIVLTALFCAFGSKLVAKALTCMTCIVIAGLLVVVVVTLTSDKVNLGSVLTTPPAGTHSNPFLALWNAVKYAALHATAIIGITAVADQLQSRSASKKAAILGICVNSLLLIALSVLLLGFSTGEFGSSTPLYDVLKSVNIGWVRMVYVVTVFIAVLSAAVGLCYGGVARFSKLYRKSGKQSAGKNILFVAVLLLVCALASAFGVTKLLPAAYNVLTYLNLFILVLPTLLLAGCKISKKFLKDNHIDVPGIDK